jgi:hypothetical protein
MWPLAGRPTGAGGLQLPRAAPLRSVRRRSSSANSTAPTFLRDSRCAEQIGVRLRKLHEQRCIYEASMRLHLPTLRQGDSLFPEFDGFRFEAAGFEPYDKITTEIRRLSARLHQQTKFADLLRWRAANLHYLVAEEGVAHPHELPAGWGLLLRRGEELELITPATWQEISEESALQLLYRAAMSGTRVTNRELSITTERWLELRHRSEQAPGRKR